MKNSLLKIADIHVERIQHSKNQLKTIFPLSSLSIANFSEENLLNIEMLTSRFAKLQDLIGTKIIDYYLNANQENIIGLTIRDKVLKLEKLGIIEKASIWTKLREIRNHLAHEYPDDPNLTASYLNEVFTLADELIKCYRNLKQNIG